jgi:hypothetical protein
MHSPLNILFELSNCDSALQAYAPIVASLRRQSSDIVCGVLSVCEFFGLDTETEKLRTVFDEVYVLSQIGVVRPSLWRPVVHRLGILPASLGTLWDVRAKLCGILRRTTPCVIVISNDRRFPEHDLVLLANRFRIPTLLLQESIRKDLAFPSKDSGKTSWVLRRLFRYEQGQLRHGEGGCTRIAAWGQNGVDYFRALGITANRLIVTGSPRIDSFIDRCRTLRRSAACDELGVPGEGRNILFATNPLSRMGMASLSDYLDAIRYVICLVDRMGRKGLNDTLLLKPHRFETSDHWLYGIPQMCSISPFAHYLKDSNLETAIAVADAVLVFNSTVAVEAALMNRPVGVVNLHGWNLGVDFVKHGLSVQLDDEVSLETFVDCAAQKQQGNVSYYVQHLGSSAERIAEEVFRLVRGRYLIDSARGSVQSWSHLGK